jgi:hypothetical protein
LKLREILRLLACLIDCGANAGQGLGLALKL